MDLEFLQIVDQLAIWKFLPSGRDRGTLAVKLAEWCDQKVERGRWLLSRVDDFDEYPGPATIRKLIKDKFEPAGPLATPPARMDKIPPQCSQCSDAGTVEMGGSYEWCSCDSARRVRDSCPDWLNVVNSFKPKRKSLIEEKKPRRENESNS